jgi:predicted transcriptional regulator
MSTISVPLTPELEKRLAEVAEETGASRAAVVRNALKHYNEDIAVQKVLRAMKEPTLSGDLDTLLRSID